MLTKKYRAVADAMFEEQLTDEEAVRRFQIQHRTLRKLLENRQFQEYLDSLCEQSMRNTRFILARHGPAAAKRLAELLENNEKPEVARRAALDMINRGEATCKSRSTPAGGVTQKACDISADQARMMILKLAQDFQTDG